MNAPTDRSVAVTFDLDELKERLDSNMKYAEDTQRGGVVIGRATWVMARSLCDEYERLEQRADALAAVVRKLVNDETAVYNEGGYIVVNDIADSVWGGTGSRSIDLTAAEQEAVREALA